MADPTPKIILEEQIPARVQQNPQIIKDVNAVYEFNINGDNGGVWTVDLTEAGAGKVSEGSTGNAKCIVTVGDQDFVNIVTKKTNAQMAFMSGKLKVKGDMGLALKLQKILG